MDRGPNFMSQLLGELYQMLGMESIRTVPYHPQTGILVERFKVVQHFNFHLANYSRTSAFKYL